MVGFEVTPLMPSSSTRRRRMPSSSSSRLTLSIQIDWPSSSISRSLLLMALPVSRGVVLTIRLPEQGGSTTASHVAPGALTNLLVECRFTNLWFVYSSPNQLNYLVHPKQELT